jgi:hypothetical protein
MNRRRLLAVLVATAAASALPACAHPPMPQSPGVVAIEVFDRTDQAVLPVYWKEGRQYVVGTPGHEYALRLRNTSARRVLAVTSVDGVNVVTGQTASPDQSGYVIERFGTVEITGWRKSLERAAAFYFTDLGDSYAARTGRPLDVGVIGVAAFPEKDPYPQRDRTPPAVGSADTREGRADAQGNAAAGDAPKAEESTLAKQSAQVPMQLRAQPSAPRIGTGHGRDESSPVQYVRFERESATPAHTIVVQYDRRENLIAQGVLPSPSIASRNPNPFPALRFVPDPPPR